MSIIQSGSGVGELKVDTSKAARVSLYDSSGNEINPTPTGTYYAGIDLTLPAAMSANVYMWAIRAGSNRTMYIKKIQGVLAFAGTASAATDAHIAFYRYSGGGFPTTNSEVFITKRHPDDPTSDTQEAVYNESSSGLGTLSGTAESNAMIELMIPRSVTGLSAPFRYNFRVPGESFSDIELAPGEGLAIRVGSAGVPGGTLINGSIEWDER